jgi:hypothetical protein
MLNIAKMTWKICQIQAEFCLHLFMSRKMDKSLSNFLQNFNKSSLYLPKEMTMFRAKLDNSL